MLRDPLPEALRYSAAVERTFGGPVRYEAEAPTAYEALALLRDIEDERAIGPEPAAEKSSERKIAELKAAVADLRAEAKTMREAAATRIIAEEKRKTERDDLRLALHALVVEAQSHMACLCCQGRYDKGHSPTCPVEKAARLLGENREKGATDGE